MRLFSILAFMFSFMTLKIVDEGGAGGSDGEDADGYEGDDDAADKNSDGESESLAAKDGGLSDDEKSELARLKKIVDDNERSKRVVEVVSEIKSRHNDFDENKVRDHLIELKKSDPQKAEAMNNPIGWELIHLQNFATKDVDNDYVGHGREGEFVDRSAEIFEAVIKGGVSRADEAAALSKYL